MKDLSYETVSHILICTWQMWKYEWAYQLMCTVLKLLAANTQFNCMQVKREKQTRNHKN